MVRPGKRVMGQNRIGSIRVNYNKGCFGLGRLSYIATLRISLHLKSPRKTCVCIYNNMKLSCHTKYIDLLYESVTDENLFDLQQSQM
ncbi:hypothetical protein HanRHA438_Chr09g0395541 [Helianthus annuus]|nr:hypothetical protein HanRHA438_Chr09g0395541 [Helianthus annuus]